MELVSCTIQRELRLFPVKPRLIHRLGEGLEIGLATKAKSNILVGVVMGKLHSLMGKLSGAHSKEATPMERGSSRALMAK